MKITPQRSTCLFCHRKADSGEHLFSNWLKEMFPHSQQQYFTTLSASYRGRPGGPIEEVDRRHRRHPRAVNTVKHYVVCKFCNTRWMSRMEARTKPILTPIIQGHTLYFRRREIRILERWLAKTVIVNELGYSGPNTVPATDLIQIKRNLPLQSHWQIWMGRGTNPDRGLATSYNVVRIPLISADGQVFPGYASCTMLLFGTLVVFILVSNGLVLGYDEKAPITKKLRLITPGAQSFDWPPKEDLSDSDILSLSETLMHIFNGPAPP